MDNVAIISVIRFRYNAFHSKVLYVFINSKFLLFKIVKIIIFIMILIVWMIPDKNNDIKFFSWKRILINKNSHNPEKNIEYTESNKQSIQ